MIVRYAQLPRSITRAEWIRALEAFDLLHRGQVVRERKTRTFQQFYQENIDSVQATPFLMELMAVENVDKGGSSLVARFVHNARFFPLRSDFYILRLFDTAHNAWLDVVLLKFAAWHQLNGKPTICTWETVADVLPTAAQM